MNKDEEWMLVMVSECRLVHLSKTGKEHEDQECGEVRRYTEKRGEGTENVLKAISREYKKRERIRTGNMGTRHTRE